MLRKLFYNDFYAIKRYALPRLVAAFGCSACAFFILLLDAVLPSSGDIAVFLDNILTSFLIALLFAVIILLLLSAIHIFVSYYQSFFADEGYLTFMIPATREQLLISKLLAGSAWGLILLFSAFAAIAVGGILPVELLMRAENASFLSALIRDLSDYISVLGVFDLFLSLIAQVILIDTAITLGSLLAKRKLLGSLLFVCLLSGGLLLLRTLLSLLFHAITDSGELFTSLLSLLLSLAAGVGGYLISRTLLNHKLNLV